MLFVYIFVHMVFLYTILVQHELNETHMITENYETKLHIIE